MGMIKKFCRFLFCAAFIVCALAGQCLAAEKAFVQITLYDTSQGGRVVASGRGALLPIENRVKLFNASPDPKVSALPHTNDEFYLKLISRDGGAASFRVRYQKIVNKTCTALEIRDYSGVRPGETCELVSSRGKIRAVLKLE